ncbi:DUF6371 domain-containing protein [Lacinutrix sp. 5H-3-7-4]|uniref:DUF6371 domain-containing protein n=1 Tax=Lacinutrix sp. (strain 5H-3-7-4) TaxID=983544 RepID=UPI00020A33E1|nr:DUF6371 domain-containing protein [Lacinutrix sp. 5H-3-7-4]AEH01405.1 hypothetical protein Lacal_1557 [Lacinutrix sp. 5H-3-7-4]
MNFKYQLDKSSKKYYCPNCNKKTFVRYVDTQNQHYINAVDGRCDRESKCGYFKKPNNNKCVTSVISGNTFINKPTYHKASSVLQTINNCNTNNFINYLRQHFVPIDIKRVSELYKIGNTNYWRGDTVFWQIDDHRKVRAGKIMLYDCNTGKRIKKPYNHVNWMHKKLNLNDFVLQQCLFGLHCITKQESYKTICIVESEKTAIIMSIIFPSNIWMATGSKFNFKESLLLPIKNRQIIAYPDKSEYKAWLNVCSQLNTKGFKIICSKLVESSNINDGDDLVDICLENLTK